MMLSTKLEEVWSDLELYNPYLTSDDSCSPLPTPADFDDLSDLEDLDQDEEINFIESGPVLVQDLQDALDKCKNTSAQNQQSTDTTTQESIASALENAFHKALADVLDPQSSTNKKERRPLSSRRRKKASPVNYDPTEFYQIFSTEITDFWDGWFDELETEEEISSLEEEIYTIEEELARVQQHKRSLRTIEKTGDTPLSSPAQVQTFSPSPISPNVQRESRFVTLEDFPLEIVHSPFVDILDLSVDSDTNISGSSSDETSPVIISHVESEKPAKKRPSIKRNAGAKLKKKKLETTNAQVTIVTPLPTPPPIVVPMTVPFTVCVPVPTMPVSHPPILPKRNSSPTTKPKRKLPAKQQTSVVEAKEVFKVEQVLKIKSTQQDCEDEDVDIGDLTDCVNN